MRYDFPSFSCLFSVGTEYTPQDGSSWCIFHHNHGRFLHVKYFYLLYPSFTTCINQIPTWTLTQWVDGRIYDSSWSPACSPRNHGQTNRTEEFLAWDHYWTKWLHCRRTQNLPGNCSRNMPPQKRRPPLLLRWKRG